MPHLPPSKNYVLEPEDIGLWSYNYARLYSNMISMFTNDMPIPAVVEWAERFLSYLAHDLGVTETRLREYLDARYPMNRRSAPPTAEGSSTRSE